MNNKEIIVEKCEGPSMSLECMIAKLKDLPKPKYIYRGIVHPSLGVIFGPAKSGKTVFVENLLFSIASGADTFLGSEIYRPNQRVLLFGLEEYYANRTDRNQKQISQFGENQDWVNNVLVIDETFPRYLQTKADWDKLEKEIERHKPGIVMIDSLTRLSIEPIEDSTVASKLMKKLKELTFKYQVTFIIIHHTQKMDNKPLTISSLAGSRVIGQECDFMIGINKTTKGVRYIKDVAYRYAPDDFEKVLTFTMDDNLIVHLNSEVFEHDLLDNESQMPFIESDIQLKDYILKNTITDPNKIFLTAEFTRALVDTGIMSSVTFHAATKRLIKDNFLQQVGKGKYCLVAIGEPAS